MEILLIEETIATPKVIFNYAARQFEISGCSRPEDVRNFYKPIIDWLTNFRDSVSQTEINAFSESPMVFNFKFDYFNSSSAKFILDILVLINQIHSAGINTRIDWFYEENDEDMKEVGEELSEVVDFPFEYIEIKK